MAPPRQLHVICDNYATHEHPRVRAWLGKHPRVQLRFTPTSASWLNLVEALLSIVERQALRRGDFASVTDLITAITRFCTAWNECCQPFAWTKPADEILAKLNRQTNSATEHYPARLPASPSAYDEQLAWPTSTAAAAA